jgi:hypothetical protein
MGWGIVSHTGLGPWGEVESWMVGVDECAGGSGGGVSMKSGTSNVTEASV